MNIKNKMKNLPLANKVKFNKHTIIGLMVFAAILATYFVYHSFASGSDIVNVAGGQVGVKEGANNCNPYGPCGQPWCAYFVTWVYQHAGYTQINTGYTGTLRTQLQNAGWYRGHNGVPQPGDIVMFSNTHAGIAVSVSGSTVHTIEGNIGPDGAGYVGRVDRDISSITDWGGPGGAAGGGGTVSGDPLPKGQLSLAGCNFVGWAYDPSDVRNQIPIDIYINGNPIGRHYANAYRPDVGGAAINPDLHNTPQGAYHGFDIPVPQGFRNGQAYTYSVYAINIPDPNKHITLASNQQASCAPPPASSGGGGSQPSGGGGNQPSSGSISAPSGLHVISKTNTTVTLGWNGVSGAKGYKVIYGGKTIGTTGSTSMTINGLHAGTSYTFYVKSYNSSGTSGKSGGVTVRL